MKFRTNTADLVDGLSIAIRALSARSTMPVLEGVLIKTSEKGLALTCSDGSISIVTTVPAEVSEEGGVVLPGRLFFEVMRKLPDSKVSASMNDNLTVTFRCMGSRTTIAGQNHEFYPALPQISADNSIAFPQAVLRDMIQQTSFAISTDETRMVLTGCLFEVQNGEARMVALDGFRLASRMLRVNADLPAMSIIIPGRTLAEMAKILTGDEESMATLNFTKNQMTIELENTMFYSTLIEGEFIKYRQILPNDWKTRVKVNCAELNRCVDRASLLAREGKNHLVRMQFDQEKLVITANSESGDAYEELPVEIEGDDLTIAFNVKYITDVMRALGEEDVYLRFNSGISPCLICPVEGDAFVYLVLPVRLNA